MPTVFKIECLFVLSLEAVLQRKINGGSRSYVEPLVRPFRDRVRLSTPVERLRRLADRVEISPGGAQPEPFDQVVIAAHRDQALALLADPSDAERQLLSAIPYQKNDTVLRTDSRLLPVNTRARASWNCRIPPLGAGGGLPDLLDEQAAISGRTG